MKGIVEDPTAEVAESAGFGCAVNNRFGQLLEDDAADPFDIIREAQAEKKKKKKDEPKKVAPAKPAVKKESQKDRRAPISGGGGEVPAQTRSLPGQRVASRGGLAPAEERGERRVGFRDRRADDNEASLGFSIERPAEHGERGPRGRGGGRGGGRGMRGTGQFRSTDGFDQRGKREFERHSGSDRTGVRPEEKRGGSGPRNWGSMRDHMSAAADGAPTEEVAEGEEGAEPAEAGANPPAEGEAVAEPAVEMSLDEWKALQQQSRPKAEFNLRKPDASVPSNSMVIHKSKKQLEEQAEEADDEEGAALRRPANDITTKLEINFGSLGRPARGARGGRGGRGRGGPGPRPETTSPQKPPEKPRVQARVPNHADPEDFPALA